MLNEIWTPGPWSLRYPGQTCPGVYHSRCRGQRTYGTHIRYVPTSTILSHRGHVLHGTQSSDASVRIFCDARASMDTVPRSFTPWHRTHSYIGAIGATVSKRRTPRCTIFHRGNNPSPTIGEHHEYHQLHTGA